MTNELNFLGDLVFTFRKEFYLDSLGDFNFFHVFFFYPEVLSFIEDDKTKLEAAPLAKLAEQGELMAFKHRGYWKPMDTLREKRELEADLQNKNAPWASGNK